MRQPVRAHLPLLTHDGARLCVPMVDGWFITPLTIGYLVSRGLTKSGSRTRDTDPPTD